MQSYKFTGHLSPLPPGIKLPLELSGTVYLPTEVEATIAAYKDQIERMQATLNTMSDTIRRQAATIRDLERAARKRSRSHRGA